MANELITTSLYLTMSQSMPRFLIIICTLTLVCACATKVTTNGTPPDKKPTVKKPEPVTLKSSQAPLPEETAVSQPAASLEKPAKPRHIQQKPAEVKPLPKPEKKIATPSKPKPPVQKQPTQAPKKPVAKPKKPAPTKTPAPAPVFVIPKITPAGLPITVMDWVIDKPDSRTRYCTLKSTSRQIDDGAGKSPVYLLVSPKHMMVVTKSDIDLTYPNSGLILDEGKRFTFDRVMNATNAVIENNYQSVINTMENAKIAAVELGFWPTWPHTQSYRATIPVAGFKHAYDTWQACNKKL